jgi:hypothetical protein
MIPASKLAPMVFLFATLTNVVGCAQSVENTEEEEAIEQQLKASKPVILEIERPIDLTFDFSDVSEFAVQTPTLGSGAWRPATTSGLPALVERPSEGSRVIDQVRSGFGSGPCRLRLNVGRKEVGVRCKWRF